jgi:hypothetical protein
MSSVVPTKGAMSEPFSVASNIVRRKSDKEFVRHQARLARSGMKRSAERLTRRLQSGGGLGRAVEQHPFIAVGVAATAGILIARALGGHRSSARTVGAPRPADTGHHGWMESLLAPVMTSVQSLAIGAAQRALRRVLTQWSAPTTGDRASTTADGGNESPAP